MVALAAACRTPCRSMVIGVSAFSSVSKLARQKNRRDASSAFLTSTRLYQRDGKAIELSDDTEKKSNGLNLKLFGGDFAGHSASFNSQTGSLIPVPEYLLPESMIEWGQVPSSWEVLTSEDWKDDCDLVLERNVVKVVPEVGCGVDNLDTMSSKETFAFSSSSMPDSKIFTFDSGRISSISHTLLQTTADKSHSHKMEAVFSSFPSDKVQLQENDSGNEDQTTSTNNVHYPRRIRVSMEILIPSALSSITNGLQSQQAKQQQAKKPSITSPIQITSERRTSLKSTAGTIAKGGGLDGRTVTNLIGKQYINMPFSDQESLDLNFVIDGTGQGEDFILRQISSDAAPDNIQARDDGSCFATGTRNLSSQPAPNGADNVLVNPCTVLSLPGNIVVRYGVVNSNHPWGVEVIYFNNVQEGKTMKIDGMYSKQIIKWIFDLNGEVSIECWEES